MKTLKIYDKITKTERTMKISQRTIEGPFYKSTVNAFLRAAITRIVTDEYISCGIARYDRAGDATVFVISEDERANLLSEVEYRIERAGVCLE